MKKKWRKKKKNNNRNGSGVKKRHRRKGTLNETISYAIYSDTPSNYFVSYRDFDSIKEASLDQFVGDPSFQEIPKTRILSISKNGRIVWQKGQKTLDVKNKNP